MLTRDEIGLLQGQLALALSAGDPKNSIKAYFGIDASAILRDLPANLSTNDEYAWQVIDFCMRSRWTLAPSLMEKLLGKLLAGGVSAGTAELMAALVRVKLKQDPNDKCYNTYWVLRDQPFLNRQSLRPVLKDFIQSSDRSLLKICGPGAGRTYTGELLDYLSSQLEDLHFVPVTLNKEDGPSYKVQSFAADLLNPMGEDVPESSSSSDAGELCRRILRTTKKQLGLWIFVLDGFEQTDLQPQIKELIRLLAEKCTIPEYRRKVRLVLINYSEPFERLLPAAIAKEEILIPSVNRQDLIDCLTQLNNQRLQIGLPQLDGLGTIADAMLAGAPAAGDPRTAEKLRLRYLYDRLHAVATMVRS
jgi:hypothetical protein